MQSARVLWWRRGASLALLVFALAYARSMAADDFTASMDAAMARMNHDMMLPPTGDPDRDFAAMMIPHHQGAIDMAEVELRFGHDQVLRRLAQAIIVEQQQEIAVMRQELAVLQVPATPSNAHAHMPKER
ncbi:MAG: DUF305 domain-containing protein [Rhodopila sp.]|nr:DUF305 domain-containing protein [Rhodopila sp.]